MRRTITRSIKQRLAEISLAAGAAGIGAATLQDRPAQAIAGVGLMMLGATRCVMGLVERAVRDTSHERDRLQQTLRETQAEHTRYLVARAFVDREAEDLCRLMKEGEEKATAYIVAEAKRLNTQVAAERERLLAEVEDRSAALKTQGFIQGLNAQISGITLDSDRPAHGARVIHLPRTPIGSDATTAGRGSHLS